MKKKFGEVRITEAIPTWALCSIINGDDTGLEDEEIQLIQSWFEETGYDYVCSPRDDAEPYFTPYPAFGKACDVMNCECVIL